MKENSNNNVILKHSQGYTLSNENIINIDFINERIDYIVKVNNNEIVMNDNFKDFDEILIDIKYFKTRQR